MSSRKGARAEESLEDPALVIDQTAVFGPVGGHGLGVAAVKSLDERLGRRADRRFLGLVGGADMSSAEQDRAGSSK